MNGVFLDFISIGIILGMMHAIFLALFLLSIKKGNTLSFKILSCLLIAMAVGMAGNLMHQLELFAVYPFLGLLFPANEFLYGPLFYLYVQSMVKPHFNRELKDLIHFAPAISFLIISMLPGTGIKPLIWGEDGSTLKLIIALHVLLYLYLSIKTWMKYAVSIEAYYSTIGKIRMNWLRNVIIGMCVVYLVSLLPIAFTTPTIFKLTPLAGSILIYVTAYLGMRHSKLFSTADVNYLLSTPQEKTKNDKYSHSGLDAKKKAAIQAHLTELMEKEKLFADNALTLPKLAEKLSVTTHHLSQVLNEGKGKTFFDFVSEYRVKEVQKLMADPNYRNYTLLGLAMEAGFNSKSAFNIVFKKHTKQTPLQYRNSLLEEKTN